MRILLLLMGTAFFAVAGYGIRKGKIYCKGRCYSRDEQSVMFWFSVAVFFAFGAMLFYFSLFKNML